MKPAYPLIAGLHNHFPFLSGASIPMYQQPLSSPQFENTPLISSQNSYRNLQDLLLKNCSVDVEPWTPTAYYFAPTPTRSPNLIVGTLPTRLERRTCILCSRRPHKDRVTGEEILEPQRPGCNYHCSCHFESTDVNNSKIYRSFHLIRSYILIFFLTSTRQF